MFQFTIQNFRGKEVELDWNVGNSNSLPIMGHSDFFRFQCLSLYKLLTDVHRSNMCILESLKDNQGGRNDLSIII